MNTYGRGRAGQANPKHPIFEDTPPPLFALQQSWIIGLFITKRDAGMGEVY